MCSAFNKVSSRASELKGTYDMSMERATDLLKAVESMIALHVSDRSVHEKSATCPSRQLMENVDCDGSTDKSNPSSKAKGLKKRNDPFRGRRRTKSYLERALTGKTNYTSQVHFVYDL